MGEGQDLKNKIEVWYDAKLDVIFLYARCAQGEARALGLDQIFLKERFIPCDDQIEDAVSSDFFNLLLGEKSKIERIYFFQFEIGIWGTTLYPKEKMKGYDPETCVYLGEL